MTNFNYEFQYMQKNGDEILSLISFFLGLADMDNFRGDWTAFWFAAFKAVLLGLGIAGALYLILVIIGVSRMRGHKPVHGKEEFLNADAYVFTELNPKGLVRFKGEIWRAVSKNGHTISRGETVKIIARKDMTLLVDLYFDDPSKNI